MVVKVGIFIDAANIYKPDTPVNYRELLKFAEEVGDVIRANVYLLVDPDNLQKSRPFVDSLRAMGYKVVEKPFKKTPDGPVKTSITTDLAVDCMLQSDKLDLIILISGDGDFKSLVKALQSRGKRVEIIAYSDRIAYELRREADHFTPLENIDGIFRRKEGIS